VIANSTQHARAGLSDAELFDALESATDPGVRSFLAARCHERALRHCRQAESPWYNDVPETRGTPRHRGAYGPAGTGRDREDAERPAAWRAQERAS
jgi:hypothetical protein